MTNAAPLAIRMADAIRILSVDAVAKANSGHAGAPMGLADVATVLWTKVMKYDAGKPDWADRDRFVLSAGHGSMLIYSLLHLAGVKAVSMDQIRNFRQWGSNTPGHPEYGHTPGVETTTGPLGQGISTAVGMAMAERRLAAEFGPELVDHRTWVLAGDGCLMEGVSHEAISLAGRLKLAKLTVIWDDNDATIDGKVGLSETGDQLARFKAAGWAVKAIDGHDHGQIRRALLWAQKQDRPSLIAAKTKIGRGAGSMEGNYKAHGVLSPEIAAETRVKLGWTAAPFEIPDDILKAWRSAGRKGARARKAWAERLAASPKAAEFNRRVVRRELPADAFAGLDAHLDALAASPVAEATRQSSGAALAALVPKLPELMGGSADLTGSVNTLVKGMSGFDAPAYAGDYVYYGVREHAMAAAMNGMALHGGIIPYAGTFMVFSDYSRPAIRLGALMGVQVVHVMTHDSIGVGEDGPTHQPVEHLAALRAMPGLYLFRPADAVEAAEAWASALTLKKAPSMLSLSRQKTAPVRKARASENLTAKGAYELSPASGPAKVSLFSTGTEVALALKAQQLLEAEGVPTRVVSAPCWALFEQQDAAYKSRVLGDAPAKVAVEAAVRFGWDRFIGPDGGFVGMTGFGASAPAEVLYKEFGITAEAVAAEAKRLLAKG
jgi:transketolase